MVAGKSIGDYRDNYRLFLAKDKIPSRWARIIKYLGFFVSYHNGGRGIFKFVFLFCNFRVFISSRMVALLLQ